MISIDDFKKVEIKAGKIVSAEKVPDTDKLLKLSVDFGMKKTEASAPAEAGADTAPAEAPSVTEIPDVRQIISGIAPYFPDPQTLVGTTCAFATNLEPRTIKGLTSNGMVLAVSTDSAFSLLKTSSDIPPGTSVR